jgi:thiamine monophosphate synthase
MHVKPLDGLPALPTERARTEHARKVERAPAMIETIEIPVLIIGGEVSVARNERAVRNDSCSGVAVKRSLAVS